MLGPGLASAAAWADLVGVGRPVAVRASAAACRSQGPLPRLFVWVRFKDAPLGRQAVHQASPAWP
eukprot:259742-Lingulodinium_polyedra.AAC.1